LFYLDDMGNLRTVKVFDYATDPREYTVRILATDEYGTTHEKVFTLSLVDVPSVPITDFRLSNHSVVENKPAGTEVGTFSVAGGQQYEMFYNLVSGEGDQGNFYFNISEDGRLSTARLLDHEIFSHTTIRVRAENGTGAVKEKVFHIYVEDQPYMPKVETTIRSQRKKNGVFTRFRLGGVVFDKGEIRSELEMGVLISRYPLRKDGLKDGRAQKYNLYTGKGVPRDNFAFDRLFKREDLENLGDSLYILAFAKSRDNKIRIYGEQQILELSNKDSSGLMNGSAELWGAEGWWENPWFGTFYNSSSGWLLQLELGWVYPAPAMDGSIWLWKEETGWLWTNGEIYPFLYSNDEGGWLYFFGQVKKKRLFYNYSNEDWEVLDERGTLERAGAR
jgi:hypothetical protein